MSTLIAVYNSEGCVGRCDSKCYDAQHPECTCICGGKNHGAGKGQAVENTHELAEEWARRYKEAQATPGEAWKTVLGRELELDLFAGSPAGV